MAMSKQVPSAQLGCVMTCDLCDTVDNVNSFCRNCLQNLCDNCKKLHQKIPSLRSHDIGSIGDGRRIHKSEELLCSDHGEILTNYCKTCSMNVCPKCLSNHLKHDLLDIDEEGQRMKEELEQTLESKAKLLEEIRDSRDLMLQHKTKFDSVEEEVISKIEHKFDMILKLKTDLKDAVIGKNAEGREKIHEQISVLQNFESKLDGEMRRINEDLPLHSGPTLIKFAQKESKVLRALKTPSSDNTQLPNAMELSAPTLSKIVESTNQITDAMRLGIAQIKAKKILSEDILIVSSFNPGKFISSIAYDKDDKAWVSCGSVRVANHVDWNGNVHQTIKMTPNPVYLAKRNDGNILVTSANAEPVESHVRIFDYVGNHSIFAKLTKFDKLYDLAFDHIGFLYCHSRVSRDDFILKIDEKGEIIWKTELDSDGFFVSSITFSPLNVCYIGLKSKVYVVGNDGKILKRKDWDSELGNLGPIMFDNNGFLLAGTDNGAVYILSEDFDVLKTYTPDNFKDSCIKAFACDSDNNLWIGNDTGRICVMKYTNV